MRINPTLKVAIILALIAGIIRLLAFYGGFTSENTPKYVIFMHMLFILLSVFFGIRNSKLGLKEQPPISADLKSAVKAGGVYTLLSTAFVYVYFRFIDINYFVIKQQAMIEAEIKSNGGSLEDIRERVENTFSLMNYATVTLLGLMVITFLYAVVFVILDRYFLQRYTNR